MEGELFEWIVCCGKQEYCLTESQYQYLLQNRENKLVVFDNMTINPAYISSAWKQKAKRLKKIYPCFLCKGNGSDTENGHYVKCSNCLGSGVDLKIKPVVENILIE